MRIIITIIISNMILMVIYSCGDSSRQQSNDLRGLAKMEDEFNDYDDAFENYKRAIEENPEDPANYFARGKSYLEHKMYKQAINDFSASISRDSLFLDAYKYRGISYYEKKEYRRAILDFSAALDLYSADKNIMLRRAKALLAIGDTSNACSDLKNSAKYGEYEAAQIFEKICQK